MRRLALVIGSHGASSGASAAYAGDDAAGLAQKLEKVCVFESVTLLASTEGGRAPTRQAILAALRDAAGELRDEDLFFFYFAGRIASEGGEAYLVADDTDTANLAGTAVPLSRLGEVYERVSCRFRAVVLDASRGQVEGGGDEPLPQEAYSALVESTQRGAHPGVTTAVLSASQAGQSSYLWESKTHSVFTHYLLQAFAAFAGKQAMFDFKQLASYTRREVVQWSTNTFGELKQEPRYVEFGAAEPIYLRLAPPAGEASPPAAAGAAGGGKRIALPKREVASAKAPPRVIKRQSKAGPVAMGAAAGGGARAAAEGSPAKAEPAKEKENKFISAFGGVLVLFCTLLVVALGLSNLVYHVPVYELPAAMFFGEREEEIDNPAKLQIEILPTFAEAKVTVAQHAGQPAPRGKLALTVPKGEHTLVVKARGFQTYSQPVVVKESPTVKRVLLKAAAKEPDPDATLTQDTGGDETGVEPEQPEQPAAEDRLAAPAPVPVTIRYFPPDATVSLAGAEVVSRSQGKLEARAFGKTTNLSITAPGYEGLEEVVSLAASEVDIERRLQPRQSAITFFIANPISVQADFRVFLDGERVESLRRGLTSITIEDVEPGEHTLRVEHDDYDPFSQSVEVKEGAESQLTVKLPSEPAVLQIEHNQLAPFEDFAFDGTLTVNGERVEPMPGNRLAYQLPSEEQLELEYVVPGFAPFKQSVQLVSKGARNWPVRLSPDRYRIDENTPPDMLMSLIAQRSHEAEYHYGLRLVEGRGVPRDPRRAMTYLVPSAQQGNLDALLLVAKIRHQGLYGLEKDISGAVDMYERVANTGNAEAFMGLADIYSKGLGGVERAPDLAHAFHLQAAKRGVKEAQLAVARNFAQGTGTETDLVGAAAWWIVVAHADPSFAQQRDSYVNTLKPDLQDMAREKAQELKMLYDL